MLRISVIKNSDLLSPSSGIHVDLKATLERYREPSFSQGIKQLVASVIPFCLLWGAMWFSLGYSVWLTLLLAVPTAGFLVRIYILHHDCGHGSLFKSKKLNDITGFVLGLLVFTPYLSWRRHHALHHASSGNLDRRGFGDVETMTVSEYLRLTSRKRLAYRLYRNPLFLFGVAPAVYFVILQRFTFGLPPSWKKERVNIHYTNLALAACIAALCWLMGWRDFLMVHVPVTILASSLGVWLFYVQHNFEGTYWEHHDDWDFAAAALEGSSYYHLPKVLEWMTASIGFHHIHHLDSRIPSYRLQECYANSAVLQRVNRLTLRQSLSCINYKLWDEQTGRMVGFSNLHPSEPGNGHTLCQTADASGADAMQARRIAK